MSDQSLLVWTIYESPKDFPGKFVVRPHETARGSSRPLATHFLADTLDGARQFIPMGLVCMHRDPSDDPVIVESWI
jgi:hypothetical protein